MNKQNANVIVHLSGPVNNTERVQAEQAVAVEPGVSRARVNPKAERMVLVDYDPSIISAQRILATVRGRGLSAQLVGM